MQALVYGVSPEPFEVPPDANPLTRNLAGSPTALRHVPDPALPHDDRVLIRPRLTGICGSDSKQILLDFGKGDTDNAMAAFCSFPQVMGHEVVADVVAMGCAARGLVLRSRGSLVQAGVHAPGRWEWSPLYFKEIALVGSNAFGVEEVGGRRNHAIADQGKSGAVKVAIDQRDSR
jgi:threonine dehydrogenase-like Zn-dependent dehydrogenase